MARTPGPSTGSNTSRNCSRIQRTKEDAKSVAQLLLPVPAGSAQAYQPADRLDQLRRIITDAIFENEFDFFDVRDIGGGVAVNHHNVRGLSGGERADTVQFAEELRAVGRSNVDGFERREARFHQHLDFALVAESGNDSAVAGRVVSSEPQTPGFDEVALELQFLLEQRGPEAVRRVIGNCRTRGK